MFFDGPHGLEAIQNEMTFFYPKSPIGSMWVVDDIHVIPYDQLKESLINNGFELLEETRVKASFKRTK